MTSLYVLFSISLVVLFQAYVRTEPCDIIENMSCVCHSSMNNGIDQLLCNNQEYVPLNSTVKLLDEIKEKSRTFNSIHLTFFDKEINVNSMFINELSYLFPRTSIATTTKSKLSIKLSFPYFVELNFEDYSFYQLFPEKSNYITVLTLELTSNGQITFSPMAFNQLTVDQMFLHSSSLEPYTFEEIFNNTNIGDLTVEGITPRSNHTYRTNFHGKIRSAKFVKMVETVSSEEFPDYPVRSLTIEAHESRRINATSFVNYRNLHGLHIIRPKFFFDNRSFDGLQYITNLETIELDAETIKDHTFQHVSRIRFFSFGSNVRHLSEHSLDNLNYLTRFDASKILLDQLYPSSKCVLARFIKKQLEINPSIIILPPQAEYCDCIHDFILTLLNLQPDQYYADACADNQQERCQLSQCDVVKNFRLPVSNQTPYQPSIIDGSFVDIINDNQHIPTPSYVHRYPDDSHQIDGSDIDIQNSQTSALKAKTPMDPNAIPGDDYDENSLLTTTVSDEARLISLRNEGLKWIAISLICITILCALLVITLIWLFTYRRAQQHNKNGFKRVPPNGTNV